MRQAATWGAQNPLLTTCAVAGTSGAVVLAAPGLATAPILSNLGFTAGGIQAGMCNIAGTIHKTRPVSALRSLSDHL